MLSCIGISLQLLWRTWVCYYLSKETIHLPGRHLTGMATFTWYACNCDTLFDACNIAWQLDSHTTWSHSWIDFVCRVKIVDSGINHCNDKKNITKSVLHTNNWLGGLCAYSPVVKSAILYGKLVKCLLRKR